MACISVLFLQPIQQLPHENETGDVPVLTPVTAFMIQHPLPSLDLWTQALRKAALPVLPETVAVVAELLEVEEQTGELDANTLAQSLVHDPLMTLKVLAHVSHLCTRKQAEPPETLVGALIMLGIGPFFRDFSTLVDVPIHLQHYPAAWLGLQRVIRRSRRAAMFAVNFAMQRQDEDVVVVQEAALLHDAGEMLLWCHAPELMTRIGERLRQDHTQKMAQVQREVLGIEVIDLSQELMRSWQLSPLLRRCTDDRHAEHPQVRNVMLAVRLARHTQDGWDSPKAEATREVDIHAIAELLNISNEAAERKVRDLDS